MMLLPDVLLEWILGNSGKDTLKHLECMHYLLLCCGIVCATILLGHSLCSANIWLVVGFGVVVHRIAANYPRNYGDPER
jgi:hypothetical protein